MELSYDVIVSHGPGCNDGAVAAWAVWRSLPEDYTKGNISKEGGFYSRTQNASKYIPVAENAEFIHPNSVKGALELQQKYPTVLVFVQPKEVLPTVLIENKRVLIMDVDLGDNLVTLCQHAKSVTVIDHHDSTMATLDKHSHALFEIYKDKLTLHVTASKKESAASLAWKLFSTEPMHPLIDIVRMGDTWQWDDRTDLYPRNVLRVLYANEAFRSFQTIEDVYSTWKQNFPLYILRGGDLLKYEKTLITQMVKQTDLGFITTKDGNVYTVAYTQCNSLHSEVGATMRSMAEKRFKIPIDFCATWKYVSNRGIVSVSLRDPAPGLNLATIAQTVVGTSGTGGGHIDAASFFFNGIENLHNIIKKEK